VCFPLGCARVYLQRIWSVTWAADDGAAHLAECENQIAHLLAAHRADRLCGLANRQGNSISGKQSAALSL